MQADAIEEIRSPVSSDVRTGLREQAASPEPRLLD